MLDIMGNYISSAYDDEEERRRRELEQINQPVKTTIVTNPDGTQEMTVKGTPQALSSANPRTPTVSGPVAPVAPQAPQGGMTPDQYNAYIAQNESRNNPNIGYHMPGKSSAYGTYGMTNAAYQDVQRVNPAFAGRDIASLTPDEQTAAMNTFTQQNARYLQNYGVEPTQGNLALAHFLGARGASDYLKTGAISPAAAAANGGEERVRQIAEQRRSLGASPVSGAAQPPAPAPMDQPPGITQTRTGPSIQTDDAGNQLITTADGRTYTVGPDGKPLPARGVDLGQASFGQKFLSAQKDNDALMKLAQDNTVSPFERQLAKDVFFERYEQNKLEAKARDAMANAAQTGNFNQVSREMKSGSSIGDWLKYMFFKSNGFTDAADDMADKLGLNDTYQIVTLPNGTQANVKFGTKGQAKEGKDFTGKALDQSQLDQIAGYNVMMKGAQVGTSTFTDPVTKETLSKVDTVRGPIWYNKSGQRVVPKGEPLPNTIGGNIGVQTELADLRIRENIIKKGITNIQDAKTAYIQQQGPFGTAKNPLSEQEFEQIFAGQLSMVRQAPTAGATQTAPSAAAPAAVSGPVAPAQAAPAPVVGPAAPGQAAPASVVPSAAPAPVRSPGPGGFVTKGEAAATETAAKEEAKIGAEDIATVRKNQGSSESNADYLVSKVNGLIIDPVTGKENPGFSVSVGASIQPGFQFIPGTDKATWYEAFNEVKGQQFLTAVKELKGMGALSNQEGEAATRAISRMSTMSNEKEFKRAAQDFVDIVQRGIDRNRKKLGQEPKYGTPEASERDRQDAEALKWLKANPKDPKAADVRRRLYDRGLL